MWDIFALFVLHPVIFETRFAEEREQKLVQRYEKCMYISTEHEIATSHNNLNADCFALRPSDAILSSLYMLNANTCHLNKYRQGKFHA